jgi:hypothetical protein
MHVHLPKPLHGWREFAGEVGIIVIGVLIALTFEQVAQSVHDRFIAAEARAAIRAEVRENLWWMERREQYQPCIDNTLGQLGLVLMRVRTEQPTPILRSVRFPMHAKITSIRWDANAQAGRTSLFSGTEQRLLGNMYFTTEQFRASQEEEESVWAKLGFLEGLDHFTPQDTHDLGVLLAEARFRNRRAKLGMERAHQWASRLALTAANPNGVENLDPNEKPACPPLTQASPES